MAASGKPYPQRPPPSPSDEEDFTDSASSSEEGSSESYESESSPAPKDSHSQPVKSFENHLATSSSSFISSSSSYFTSEDEEEVEKPSQKGGACPPPDKSSDEVLAPPPPQQSKLPVLPSSEEEESGSSDSESSSEEDGPSSQPAKSFLPTLNAGGYSSSPEEEGPVTSSLPSDAHTPPKEPLLPPPASSSGLIRKLWTKEDELTLLQKLLDYKNQCGKLPSSEEEVGGFHMSVQHLFSASTSPKELIHKMVNLRRRFTNYNKKLKIGGKAPAVGHDHLLLELLGKLWGKTEQHRLGKEVIETSSSKRMKTSKELKDATPNPYEFLTMLVEHMDDKLKASGNRPWLKDHLLLLDTMTLADLEMKCFKYFINELKVSASRHDFHLRLIEAMQEEDGIIVHPSLSHVHSRFLK